ncbi:MAG: imidazole glycerol phosphate synthase subunit HisH [Clostridiales bacterium]|jgi:glutamine amidotransferase|nr:imidazole glycerol phosphate synthase subunit HisH [Clostridiales bacterium]
MKIGVIDYKAGNAPSVLNALAEIGAAAEAVTEEGQIGAMSGIILPGVGSARATMDSLKELGLITGLDQWVNGSGLPFLGICIGMQILACGSEEDNTPCLGWVPGKVLKFPDQVRIPQIGWNKVDFAEGEPLAQGFNGSEYFYFVNSYYFCPDNPAITAAETDYGIRFCSMLRSGSIAATQFHLEKSGEAGLRMLKNFAAGL